MYRVAQKVITIKLSKNRIKLYTNGNNILFIRQIKVLIKHYNIIRRYYIFYA